MSVAMFISMNYCFFTILTVALYSTCTRGQSTEAVNKFDRVNINNGTRIEQSDSGENLFNISAVFSDLNTILNVNLDSTKINETTETENLIFSHFLDQLFNMSAPLISEFETNIITKNSKNAKLSNGIENILQSDFIEKVLIASSTLIDGSALRNSTNIINIAYAMVDQFLNAVQRVSDSIDNEACKSDIQLYFRDLKAGQSWAMKMLDSTAKVPDSLLTGNMFVMGNYDECVAIEGVESNFGEFRGQYCVLDVIPSPKQLNKLMGGLLKNIDGIESASGEDFLAAMVDLKWAMCLPSSCRTEDIEVVLQQARPHMLNDVTVKVDELGCRTSEKKPFRPVDWLAIGVLTLFGLLAVLSTIYDLVAVNASGDLHKVLRSFSLYANGSKILRPTPTANNLPALHGIRVLSMLWVILGHTYSLAGIWAPGMNRIVLLDLISDWGHLIVLSAQFSVDSFFLLSGFLICYLLLGSLDSGIPFNVPVMYLYRYIRLTPPLAVMVLLTASLFKYVGDGPQWEMIQGYLSSQCDANWWATLIYINNYYNPIEGCVGQSWYISADTQLFWLSPLIIYPLWKWPKLGKCLLAVSILCGCFALFLISYFNEITLTFIPILMDQEKIHNFSKNIYFPTHTRFTPWLIGIGLGYFLHHSKNTTVCLNKFVVALGWLTSAVLMLVPCIVEEYFQQPGYEYNKILESVYSGLARPAWALGLAWVIVACVKGYGGFVNSFLSWSFFQVLSRLTYCVYLTHLAVLMLYIASLKQPMYFDNTTFVMLFFGVTVISIAAAFVLSLVFEAPLIFLGKHILEKYYPFLMSDGTSKIGNIVGKNEDSCYGLDSLPDENDSTAKIESVIISNAAEVDKVGYFNTELCVYKKFRVD